MKRFCMLAVLQWLGADLAHADCQFHFPLMEQLKVYSQTANAYLRADREFECFEEVKASFEGLHSGDLYPFFKEVIASNDAAFKTTLANTGARVSYHKRLVLLRSELLFQATLSREASSWDNVQDEITRTGVIRRSSAILADLIYRLPDTTPAERLEVFRGSLMSADTYFIGPAGYSILLVGIANCGSSDLVTVKFNGAAPLCSDLNCLETLNAEIGRFRKSLAMTTRDGWLAPFRPENLTSLPATCVAENTSDSGD